MENLENSSDSGKIFGALLIGAAIGAAIGILLAPQKGSTLRKNITENGDSLVQGLRDKFNSFLEGIRSEVSTVKETTEALTKDGRAKVGEVLK